MFLNWIKSGLMIVISNRVGDFLRFLTRLKRMLFDRRGSQTIEYVTILAAGATLAMILLSVIDSKEIKGTLIQKIEQAMSLNGSATEGKDGTDDSPGWVTRGVDSVKNGWNRLTGLSSDAKESLKVQRTMNLDIQGNSGFGGPKGGGPRGAGGHVDNGGGYRGDGRNAKESPSFFERFTGWFDNKWNSLTKRFKGDGGGSTGGGKPSNNGKGKKSFKSPELKINGKQFGKKSGKHAQDYGLDPKVPENRQWIKNHIKNIHKSPNEVRQGSWRGIGKKLPDGNRGSGDALFYRKGNDVVVTDMQGNFITPLKDGAIMNARFRNAIRVFGD
ncbi:hypothetical protein JOD24_003274 [Kroppenstedtia sanguinis]